MRYKLVMAVASVASAIQLSAHATSLNDKVRDLYERARVTFLFSTERDGRIEPFGCLSGTVAGVAREWQATAEARRSRGTVVPLTLGPIFAPRFVEPEEIATLSSRSEALAEALERLGTRVAMPTGGDLLFGIPRLKALESRTGASFVNSSLVDAKTGKAVFARAVEIPTNSLPVLVLGVERPDAEALHGLKILPPEEAVARALTALPRPQSDERIVVVLSHLDTLSQRQLLARFPEINFFFGADTDKTTWEGVVQLAPGAIQLNARGQGRTVAELTVGVPTGYPLRLYNDEARAAGRDLKALDAGILKVSQRKLASATRGTTKKEILRSEIAERKKLASELEALPTDALTATAVQYRELVLDEEIKVSGDNPLSEVEAHVTGEPAASCPLTSGLRAPR